LHDRNKTRGETTTKYIMIHVRLFVVPKMNSVAVYHDTIIHMISNISAIAIQ